MPTRKIKCEFVNSANEKVYLLHKVLSHVGKVNNINPYDLYGRDSHFDDWCNEKGYGQVDSLGQKRSESNIWFQEYKDDVDGMNASPPSICAVDIFIDNFPELAVIEYIDDLEGTEVEIDIDSLIEDVATSRYYKDDTEKRQVMFLEKIKEIYGNKIYVCEQET